VCVCVCVCVCVYAERPDLGAWATSEAEKKAALELKYLETQRCVLLARRQERRRAFNVSTFVPIKLVMQAHL
jgi:hypothetical protein